MKRLFFPDVYFEYKTATTPSDQHFKHMHNEWELYYFLSGDIDYILDRSSYHLKKHDLLLIRPNVYHYAIRNTQEPYKRFVINFSPEIAEKYLADHDSSFSIFSIDENEYIHSVFEFLKELPSNVELEDSHQLLRHSLETILLLLNYKPKGKMPVAITSPPLAFQKLLDYIDEHIFDPLSVKDLADEFFVSESWVIHNFKKYLNIGAKQYINNKKILYAQSMIQSGKSATEVAVLCNFEDYSTFYRVYKKYLGCSPRQDEKKQND